MVCVDAGRSSGHSREASRAATEADSEEPEVEESGKSNGEGSGSDAWSVISHPAQGAQPSTSAPAPHKSADVAAADQQASAASEPAQSSVGAAPDQSNQEQLSGATAKDTSALSNVPATPASSEVGSRQAMPQPAQHVKQQESDEDDLSELSGSEAEGQISEAEEDWGTWE